MDDSYVSFEQARALVRRHTPRLASRALPLSRLAGHVMAAPARAKVASPSVTAAMKDGYAVMAAELTRASEQHPVRLRVIGAVAAGEQPAAAVGPGTAIRITTGAPLPPGADAVLPVELTRLDGDQVLCLAPADAHRNVLARGSDVDQGQALGAAGRVLTPELVGLLAAAGCPEAQAHPRPRVALLATGREVVAPGEPLPQGSVYASNLVTLAAWLELHRMEHQVRVVDDSADQIAAAVDQLLAASDALLISGGAWTSERDLVVGTLDGMGFEMAFRRVRMGPGKGVAFGRLRGRVVFCLPGGPPSNEMAFLQLALPALLMMAGHHDPGLPRLRARLAVELTGQEDWTQFWHGHFTPGDGLPVFTPATFAGRLKAMAGSHGILTLPQGQTKLSAGQTVTVQRLAPAA